MCVWNANITSVYTIRPHTAPSSPPPTNHGQASALPLSPTKLPPKGAQGRKVQGIPRNARSGADPDPKPAVAMADPAIAAQCKALQDATKGLQSPNAAVRAEAERRLQHFRSLDLRELFPLVDAAVRGTQDVTTRFHAVQTLRSATLDRWARTDPQIRASVRDWAIKSALEARDEVIRSQMLACCAIVLKRGWLDIPQEEQGAFFQQLRSHTHGASGSDFAVQVELEFTQALLSEFSMETASTIGMPLAFHLECSRRFQESLLLGVFEFAATKGQEAFVRQSQGAGGSGDAAFLCIVCIETMVQVLHWDFRKRVPSRLFDQRGSAGAASGGETCLQPGRAWRDPLLAPQSIAWVYEMNRMLHAGMEAGAGAGPESPLCGSVRKLVLVLSGLQGDVFAKAVEDPWRDAHLLRIQEAALAILRPEAAVMARVARGEVEQRLVDGCNILYALSENASLVSRWRVGQSEQALALTGVLGTLTLGCLSHGGAREGNVDGAIGQSLVFLMDAWENLIQSGARDAALKPGQGHGQGGSFPPQFGHACANIFAAWVDALLLEAAETAFDDVDEVEDELSQDMRDQRFAPVASVARISAHQSFPLLATKIKQCQEHVRGCTNDTALVQAMEQLCCLVELASYCIADPAEGETPLIPVLLSGGESEACTMQLSFAILELASQVVEPNQSAFASPRVLETLLKCVTGWCATYLLSEDECMPNQLRAKFCDPAQAAPVVNLMAQLAATAFVKWAGEAKVQELACKGLLAVLAGQKGRRLLLMQAPAWQQFVSYFAGNFDALCGALRADLHRALLKCMVKAASKPVDEATIKQVLQTIMKPLIDRIGLMQHAAPTSMHAVECILEGLRGATVGFTGIGMAYYAELFFTIQPVLLSLLSSKHKTPRIVYLILKLTSEFVETQISYLNPETFHRIVRFILEVLQIYRNHNMGQISLQASKHLKADEASEKYKDIRALLKLLMTLADRDMVDFSTQNNSSSNYEAAGGQVDVAHAIFMGLEMVFPLLSVELLSFPKLSRQYYDLLGHMCEVYPKNVTTLPAHLFASLADTLDFGLQSNEFQNVAYTLDALYYMVKYHLEDVGRGGVGLGHNAVHGKWEGTVIAHFLKKIMHLLVYEDYQSSLIEQSASALLVLVLGEPATFQSIGTAIIQSQAQNAPYLQSVFNALANSVQSSQLTRASRRKFSRDLEKLVIDIRGITKVA